MSTRTCNALLVLALTGCGGGSEVPAPVVADRSKTDAVTVPCALDDAHAFDDGCVVERAAGDDLILRHPDGGFRRLRIVDDGTGVVAADGAQRTSVRVVGAGVIEVSVGRDRYRLPAHAGQRAS